MQISGALYIVLGEFMSLSSDLCVLNSAEPIGSVWISLLSVNLEILSRQNRSLIIGLITCSILSGFTNSVIAVLQSQNSCFIYCVQLFIAGG